jgi:hypothetical protein
VRLVRSASYLGQRSVGALSGFLELRIGLFHGQHCGPRGLMLSLADHLPSFGQPVSLADAGVSLEVVAARTLVALIASAATAKGETLIASKQISRTICYLSPDD